MKLVINYHKPLTCKLQYSVYLLSKKESNVFIKRYGLPYGIMKEYRNCTPSPFAISGKGWIIKNGGYENESVYIIKSTYKEEKI